MVIPPHSSAADNIPDSNHPGRLAKLELSNGKNIYAKLVVTILSPSDDAKFIMSLCIHTRYLGKMSTRDRIVFSPIPDLCLPCLWS